MKYWIGTIAIGHCRVCAPPPQIILFIEKVCGLKGYRCVVARLPSYWARFTRTAHIARNRYIDDTCYLIANTDRYFPTQFNLLRLPCAQSKHLMETTPKPII